MADTKLSSNHRNRSTSIDHQPHRLLPVLRAELPTAISHNKHPLLEGVHQQGARPNVAEAVTSTQGLVRVNDATLSLLKSGGQMAAKDGAKLGAIFKNGELVAQARFILLSMTAATAIAAIGPAVAMIALQMQLGEISGRVRSNIPADDANAQGHPKRAMGGA
jgi:hypothetical protein